jgi:predicted transcriptional regulator
MSTLTLRLPDDVADRLRNVAQSRGVSVNKLVTELSVQSLAVYDAETRFKAAVAAADVPQALAVLDRLDAQNGETG